ncbi:MAG TPA: hypothetical protein VFO68_32720 [Actinophytocola sp.]|nr:hypothetical protein [Actinophytocola sp.]
MIIGTSPFMDTAIVVGPFRSQRNLQAADEWMTAQGWNTEISELTSPGDVPTVTNDEGA